MNREKIFAVSFCFLLIQISFGQNIGLRVNSEFSDNRKINTSIGLGGYLNINNFSDKIELLFSLDFTKNEKDFPNKNNTNDGMVSSFNKLFFSTSILYVIPIKEKIRIKAGSVFNYNSIHANDNYYPINIISSFKSKHIGSGLITNLQFVELFKLPLNFDIFITPTYLINIKNDNAPTNVKSDYANNLKILNIQMGLSYKIK